MKIVKIIIEKGKNEILSLLNPSAIKLVLGFILFLILRVIMLLFNPAGIRSNRGMIPLYPQCRYR